VVGSYRELDLSLGLSIGEIGDIRRLQSAYTNPITSTTAFKCIRNPSRIVVFVSSLNHAIAADIVYFLARWKYTCCLSVKITRGRFNVKYWLHFLNPSGIKIPRMSMLVRFYKCD